MARGREGASWGRRSGWDQTDGFQPATPLFQLGLLARQPPHGETSESQAWQERAWRFGARGSADTLDLLSRCKCAIWTSFPVDAAAAC